MCWPAGHSTGSLSAVAQNEPAGHAGVTYPAGQAQPSGHAAHWIVVPAPDSGVCR